MKRLPLALALMIGCCVAAASGSLARAATVLCVGGPGCYSTLQAAVDAAHDGDTITIAPGTYAGGVTIDVSVKLAGAGADQTVISGGGPVLTIGTFGASSEPTVSVEGVTITGGLTRSSPESMPFTGQEGVFALGGGVEIPPNSDFTGGAAVTISNSVITGNQVAPTTAIDSTIPCPADITISCINGDLPFARAAGGGIDNWGTLTLANTTVSNNRVGSASGLSTVASDAEGGAIINWLAGLTVSNTTIGGNRTAATAPNGRFADGGGIMMVGGTLAMSGSAVTNNTASLDASMPTDVASGTAAVAGGIHLTGNVPAAAINNSTVSGNSVSMTNTIGDATAFSGGVHVDLGVHFQMSKGVIANNNVSSTALPGSTGNAGGDSAAGELHGTISNSRISGNSVTVSSAAGDVRALAGASIFFGSITNSAVSNNHVQASAPHGSVAIRGGGLVADEGGFTLLNTTVSGNSGQASGLSGTAQGGGIFDAPIPNGPPGGPVALIHSGVTGNALTGSAAITLQGGGIYVTNPLTLTNSIISDNVPDQCFGC